ncbi:uncharacterized protein [Leptinotarsa decemlineata]|uniref:uncharacterized protein n=1 Tax=Leptinotarsa decemlineata TaxID=7539 RepID=UPI003D308AD7
MDNVKRMFAEIQESNKLINQNIKEIKNDLKNLTTKIVEVNQRIVKIETEDFSLKEKLKIAERKLRRNNIIIFGIPEEEQDPLNYFKTIIEKNLEVTLEETEVDTIKRIGLPSNNKPKPVILELVRNLKKAEIFNKVTKFKGTGLSITNNLNKEDREEQRFLYHQLRSARQNHHQAVLKGNTLIVNGEKYTYQQLKEKENIEEKAPLLVHPLYHKNNSELNTPIKILEKNQENSLFQIGTEGFVATTIPVQNETTPRKPRTRKGSENLN